MPLTDQSITMAAGQDLYTGSLAPAALLTFAMDDAATLGVPAAASIVNSGATASGPWAIPSVAGLSFSPSSGASIAAGETQFIVVTSTTAGSKSALLICAGANISGNPQSMTVTNPAVLALTFSADDTGRVGTAAAGLLQNTGNTSLPWSITPPSGIGVSPSSGTLAVGATRALVITPSAVGTHSLTVAATGATITGNPQVLVAGPALATAITLSFASTGVTGATVSVTATPNGPIPPGGGTATLAASNSGTLGSTTLTFTAGSSAAQTTTLTRSTDGASVVTMTNSMGLTNTGSGASYTSSSEVVSAPGGFRLTSSTSGVLPFTVGMAFQQGAIPSGSGIAVSGATAQATIKSTWPDGSAKLAVIAGTYTSSGSAVSVTPSAGTSSSGTALTTSALGTAIGTVTIDAGGFGSATFSGADWTSPFETWVSGHMMLSCIYRKQIGSDAHLVAWLEVRYYSTGAVEVLPWVENGYLLVSGPTAKSATYAFTMGGTTRFSATVNLLHHQRTVLVSGAAVSHWRGTDPGVVPIHDTEYIQATGLVPAYSAKTPASATAVTGLPSSFTPLQQGSFPSGMGGVGSNNYVGLLPEWDVVYLTCPQASTYKGVIFNAYSAGRYPIHYRDESDSSRWARVSQRTTLDSSGLPATSGTAPPTYSGDHQPTMGYMAYLLTGLRYHLDTVQAQAMADTFIGISASNRQNGLGLRPSQFAGSIRGSAWGLRSIFLAAATAPDATSATEYVTQATNNVNHFWTRYVGAGGPSSPVGNTQGFVQPYSNYNANLNGPVATGATTTSIPISAPSFVYYGNAQNGQFVGSTLYSFATAESRTITGYDSATNTFTVSPGFSSAPGSGTIVQLDDGKWWDAIWMQHYHSAVWAWCKDLGIAFDATTTTRRDEFYEWKAQSVVGLLGLTGATEYYYRDWSPYTLPIAPSAAPDWDTGAGPWFADWGEIYAATYAGTSTADNAPPWPFASRGAAVDGSIRNSGWGDPLATHAAGIPALSYALKHGIAGAERAYGLLTNASNWQTMATALDSQPSWAVAPSARPAYARGQAVDSWVEMTGTAMYGSNGVAAFAPSSVARQQDGTASAGAPWLDAYCGMTVDNVTGTVWQVANGGHGDYYGNEVVRLDALADAPRWAEWFKGSNGDVIQTGTYAAATYTDGAFDTERGWYLTDGVIGRAPASGHSYWCTQFVERYRRAMRFPGWSISPPGTGWKDVDGFKITLGQGVNGWDAKLTYTGAPIGGYTAGSQGGTAIIRPTTVRDPRTEKVYHVGGAGGRVWTPPSTEPSGVGTGGTWASFSSGAMSGQGASAVDTSRGRMFVVNGGTATAHHFDLDGAGGVTAVTLTGTPAADIAASPATDGWGMVYVPALDAYLLKRGTTDGAEIFKINASTFVVTLYAPSGGASVPQSNFIASNNANVYNRWQYVPRLRGIVYAPKNAANVWLLRVH